MKEIHISKQDKNQRLDKFLKKYFKGATGGFLYKMLRKKNITLNKTKATGTEILKDGDYIQVFFSDETFEKMRASNNSLRDYECLKKVPYDVNVLYEDDDIIVVNKPCGVLSQKAKEEDISLNEMILSYLIHTNQLDSDNFLKFRPSVANRLDRNTSGIVLAGKTLPGQQMLSEVLKKRTIKKIYHCIVCGEISEPMHITGYLAKDEQTNRVFVSTELFENAKEIQTEYEPLYYNGTYTCLKVHLITGRTHQIRAHLASVGHPIVGDPKYGDAKINQKARETYGIKHQLLHAYSVDFPDGRVFVAPEPKEFKRLMGKKE